MCNWILHLRDLPVFLTLKIHEMERFEGVQVEESLLESYYPVYEYNKGSLIKKNR
jgi:hypothetical protein